jgi:hypothetical protein
MGNPANAPPWGTQRPRPDPFDQMAIDAKRDAGIMRYFCSWRQIVDRESPNQNGHRKKMRRLNSARAFHGIKSCDPYR